MNTIIIILPLRAIWKLLAISSVLFLLKGHNEPGGGFIGGLILAAALTLRKLSSSDSKSVAKENKASLTVPVLGGLVLIMALIPLLSAVIGKGVFTGLWSQIYLPIAGKFSSVLMFDLCVYFIVALFSYKSWQLFRSYSEGGLP